jgi:hypothetical protein
MSGIRFDPESVYIFSKLCNNVRNSGDLNTIYHLRRILKFLEFYVLHMLGNTDQIVCIITQMLLF